MNLTKDEKVTLKLLVQKELEAVQHHAKKVFISNSPFITKVALDAPDIPFLKADARYKAFLKQLLRKL